MPLICTPGIFTPDLWKFCSLCFVQPAFVQTLYPDVRGAPPLLPRPVILLVVRSSKRGLKNNREVSSTKRYGAVVINVNAQCVRQTLRAYNTCLPHLSAFRSAHWNRSVVGSRCDVIWQKSVQINVLIFRANLRSHRWRAKFKFDPFLCRQRTGTML